MRRSVVGRTGTQDKLGSPGPLGTPKAPWNLWEASLPHLCGGRPGAPVVPWASLTTPTPLAPTWPAPHRPKGGPERSCQMLTAANYCPGVLQLALLTRPTEGAPTGARSPPEPRALRPLRLEAAGARVPGAAVTADTPAPPKPPPPRPARDARARAPVHPSRSRPPCARPRGVGEGFLKGPTRVVTHQPVGERGVTAPGVLARSAESSAARSRSSDGEQRKRRVHAAWAAPRGRDPLVRAGAAAAGGGDAAERPSRLDGC